MELQLTDNRNEDALAAVVERLKKMKRGEYTITVTKNFPQRSLDLNSYYWAVPVKIVAEHIGEDQREADKLIRQMCLSEIKLLPGGRSIGVVGEHKNLNNAEFCQFLERVWHWSLHEFNLRIPRPNEVSDEVLTQISNKYNALFY